MHPYIQGPKNLQGPIFIVTIIPTYNNDEHEQCVCGGSEAGPYCVSVHYANVRETI